MTNNLKIGVIGAGKWGKNLIKELSSLAEIKYICHTSNPETIKFLNETYPNIENGSDTDRLLQDDIKAVVIATPINTQRDIALKYINAKKNIFIEKPAGMNISETEEIVNAAKENGVVLAIGYEFIHHPAWKKMKELMSVKDIKTVITEWNKWGSFDYGLVQNLMCHDLSLIYDLTKTNLNKKYFSLTGAISESDILDSAFEANGIEFGIHINRISTEKRKTVTMVGKDFTLVWTDNELKKITHITRQEEKIEIEALSPIRAEMMDFISCVNNNQEPLSNGEMAIQIQKMIEDLK